MEAVEAEEPAAGVEGEAVPRPVSVRRSASVAAEEAARIRELPSITFLRRLFSCALLGWGLWCGAARAEDGVAHTPLEISFVFVVPTEQPVKGALILKPPEGKGDPVRMEIASPAPFALRLPASSQWEVSAEIPGFWVRRKPLTLDGPTDQVTRFSLELWPLGKISGMIRVKGDAVPLPRQVLVRTLAAPAFAKRPAAPSGALDCPVDETGSWTCSLPATQYDLVISAKGLTPHYRWNVQVPVGRTQALGTIELERGASIAGWVAVEGGGIEPDVCVARLSPLTAGGADLKSVLDLGRTAREQKVRKDGFLHFTGLAPGNYSLEVEQPGYAPVRLSPVRVDPGAETFLREPLLLRRPIELQLQVNPPLDWVGRPWRARIVRRAERPPSPVVFEGAMAEDGRLLVPDQSAGRFRVSLEDALGNTLYSEEHLVEDADSAALPIDLSFVTVEGRLRLETAPLAAILWFDGRSGANSVKVESDEEGRFHGVLPREGLWRIEVQAAKPPLKTWTRTEINAGASGKATLDIVLPDTLVFGRVVDEQGRPVAGADVIVQAETVNVPSVSDSTGRFETRGLPEGLVWLAAETSERVSNRAFAQLAEGSAVGPIEMRLRATRRLNGTVASPRGPVAGARVVLLATIPDGGGAQAVTDIAGTFQVDLPKEASRFEAIVSAPGFALQVFDAQAGSEPLSLHVTEEAGDLALQLPSGEEMMRGNLVLATYQNGLHIPANVLSQWVYGQGEDLQRTDRSFRVPRVAPGEYVVCLVPQHLPPSLVLGFVPAGAGCDSGLLAPGGTLSLKPVPPE